MKILTLIVTYNEADNIEGLVRDILRAVPEGDVLVVDDDSPDGTAGIVIRMNENRIHVMSRYETRGYGSATMEGFRYGFGNGYEVIVTIDGDRSQDPFEIPLLLDEIKSGAGVAIGSRYVGGIRVLNWDLRRLLLSMFASTYLRVLTGLKFKDCTCGFRAYRTRVFDPMLLNRIKSNGYAFLPELLFILRRTHIVEVPITFTERRFGQSKMTRRMIIEGVLRPWIMFWKRICG